MLGLRLFALELTENVMAVPELVALPEVDEAESQLGTLLIVYLTGPLGALTVYANVDAENGPP